MVLFSEYKVDSKRSLTKVSKTNKTVDNRGGPCNAFVSCYRRSARNNKNEDVELVEPSVCWDVCSSADSTHKYDTECRARYDFAKSLSIKKLFS